MAINNATRLACIEVLPDKKQNKRLASEAGIGLVQQLWRWVSSSDEQQRIGLHFQGHCQRLQRPEAQAHLHQTLDATYQRQDRAVHSDHLQGMDLRHAVPELSEAKRLAASIPIEL
jgi:hypothetical protein